MNKLILIFIILPFISFCQITIDSSHIVPLGDIRYFGNVEDDADLFSIGSQGINQTWDFSGLIAEEEDSIIFENPQNTPYGFMFPSSNLCANTDDLLFYLNNDWSGLWLLGGVDATVGPIALEKQAILKYPVNYQSSWISEWNLDTVLANTILPIPGIDLIRYKLDSAESNYIDSWGTLKLPMGNYDALRMKKTITSVDSLWGRVFPTSITINTNGMFFSPDSIWVNIGDTVFFDTGGYHNSVQVDSTTWANGDTLSNGGFSFWGQPVFNQYIVIDSNITHENGIIYYVCQPHSSMGMTGRIFIKNPWNLVYSNVGNSIAYWWVSNHQDAGFTMLEVEVDYDYGDVEYIRFMKNPESKTNLISRHTNLQVYPNPTSELLFIDSSEKISEILFKNMLGEIVLKTSFNNSINVRFLPKGLYVIEIYDEKEIIFKDKIVINR